jgi:hypothetical protein
LTSPGRSAFAAARRYVAVVLQQGRVQLDADSDQYVRVRRLLLFLAQSLENALQWVGFEPGDGRRKRRKRA